jgi:cellulose synthase/poly-beta-1,6-N-acetylglucosamine synthase-like glycosyltransferase
MDTAAIVLRYSAYFAVALICLYAVRHYGFTLNRLFAFQRHPYVDIDTADWPRVTVLIPAHNEQQVIGQLLDALLEVSYPEGRLRIVPINDRSVDRTGEIIDQYAARHPGRIEPFHRKTGKGGKAAVLSDACGRVQDEILLVFDADYIPGRGLIKQLVAPFFDPGVGAVMGRVVPWNVGRNALTRLLDLERSGGYQVDQQARMNMRLVPLYGGTVGGVRRSALEAIGGWDTDTLTEDTDVTFRLVLAGWEVVYENRSECYEEVPENWRSRIRQIQRWAIGHNQALVRHSLPLLRKHDATWAQRIDGLFLLGVFAMPLVTLWAWGLALLGFYVDGSILGGVLPVLGMAAYASVGTFAAFFEIGAATRLDRVPRKILLLPLNIFGFIVSMISVTTATLSQILSRFLGGRMIWHKTGRTDNNHGRVR